MKRAIVAIVTVFLLAIAVDVFAFGEVFRIETSGTEYCGDFFFFKFNAKSNIDLWIKIVSNEESIIYFTPDLDPTSSLTINTTTYWKDFTRTALVGMYSSEDGGYLTVRGIIKFDKLGNIKRIKGTFIEYDTIIGLDCFSTGKFWSVEKLY